MSPYVKKDAPGTLEQKKVRRDARKEAVSPRESNFEEKHCADWKLMSGAVRAFRLALKWYTGAPNGPVTTCNRRICRRNDKQSNVIATTENTLRAGHIRATWTRATDAHVPSKTIPGILPTKSTVTAAREAQPVPSRRSR